jgi:hypothetical protein
MILGYRVGYRGQEIHVYAFYRARNLAGRMAIDRGLILQTDASPA